MCVCVCVRVRARAGVRVAVERTSNGGVMQVSSVGDSHTTCDAATTRSGPLNDTCV